MVAAADVGTALVRVTTTSGAIAVTAEVDRDDVVVDGAVATRDGSVTTVSAGSHRVHVRVPEGMTVIVGSRSGRVRITGRVGAAAVTTSSGSISIEQANSVDARSDSGSIRADQVSGEMRAATSSARVEVDRCGSVHVTTRSGRVVVRSVDGPARVHCVSGRIDLTIAGAHDVDAETVSGRVTVLLPAGVRAKVVASGDGAPDVGADDHDCVIRVRSVSGRVTVSNR